MTSQKIVALCVWCLLCCSIVAAKKSSKLDTCRLYYRDSNDSVPDILYYRATPPDSDESMQYAWSTVGAPTLFVSHGPVPPYCNSSLLSVDLDAFKENQSYHSVNISGADGAFAAAVVLHRLIEFNVTKKFEGADGFDPSLAFNDSTNYTSYYLDRPNMWSFSNESQTFLLEDDNQTSFSEGPFKFSIRATFPTKADEQRLPYFPKSLYTENSTTFDLILENYPYTMTTSRVALEMVLVHNLNTSSGNVTMSTTVDDEYTPSVFNTFQYHFGRIDPISKKNKGFFQWKPISYQTDGRKSTSSQQANIAYASNDTQEEHASIPSGLASAVFEQSTDVSNVTLVYIVFGTSGDDTWNHSSYMTWTAVVGYGDVPHDRLSMLVVITIILGLGIPVVVILAGGGYVIYRRRPWQNIVRLVNKMRGRTGYAALS